MSKLTRVLGRLRVGLPLIGRVRTVFNPSNPYGTSAKALALEADDGLAAEAAAPKLFEHLARAVQVNRGADARSDRAVSEQARNLCQPLPGREGIGARRNVMRRDFTFCEPPLVCRVDRRDKAAPGFENVGIAADCVRTVDEIEDHVDTIRMSRAQCADHLYGFGVVDFFGAEAASFIGVAPNRLRSHARRPRRASANPGSLELLRSSERRMRAWLAPFAGPL
jgi:hypothetical protein